MGGTDLRIGSLFSGYGGLDLAIEDVFGATTAWVADIEKGPRAILAHRFPHAPNLGDVTVVDWSAVEPVDIIAGGSPCQDLSGAGNRAGMREGTRSGLWASMREAVAVIRPAWVVWENVRGALSAESDSGMEPCSGCVGDKPNGADGPVLRALGRVLGDLASLGYDAAWCGLRAADIGAPHNRWRVFVLAWPTDADSGRLGERYASIRRVSVAYAGDGTTPDSGHVGGGCEDNPRGMGSEDLEDNGGGSTCSDSPTVGSVEVHGDEDNTHEGGTRWGDYAPAILRWEGLTRPAPPPLTPDGKTGKPRLSPAFVEWMMGLPDGWVTDCPVTRNQAIRALGNGVVPQQAAQALRQLLDMKGDNRGGD